MSNNCRLFPFLKYLNFYSNTYSNMFISFNCSACCSINLYFAQLIEGDTVLKRKTAQDITKAVEHEFERRRRIFDAVLNLMSKLIAFMFLRVIFRYYSLTSLNYYIFLQL